ncbi:MAG: 16S rRNA (guanine(527)-N(7))-methyltransferase RsmG [Bacteroidales bacterium]|nr:16S rRNA (guanine(527)-N(7))-methyltransferase RsmG [Bacteroidales bacterium]
MQFEEFSNIVSAEFPGMTGEQMDLFRRMEPLYRDWNSRINVISRKDIDGFYEHHVLHSLAIASYWLREGILPASLSPCASSASSTSSSTAPSSRLSVLDVGTGGGFPGIPLAVLFPGISFTLCDSVGKKAIVAKAVAESLGLNNVTVVNARAESLPDRFDFVVSRAVTTLDNFYPWVRDSFKYSIFYLKGGDVNEEIAQLMGRNRLKKGSVRTWRVDNWLQGEYFQEKFVIQIEKDYLCGPIVE